MAKFYVGIAECGCVRAAQVDDEQTTAKEVAEFARRQQQKGRTMAHVEGEPWMFNPDCRTHALEREYASAVQEIAKELRMK